MALPVNDTASLGHLSVLGHAISKGAGSLVPGTSIARGKPKNPAMTAPKGFYVGGDGKLYPYSATGLPPQTVGNNSTTSVKPQDPAFSAYQAGKAAIDSQSWPSTDRLWNLGSDVKGAINPALALGPMAGIALWNHLFGGGGGQPTPPAKATPLKKVTGGYDAPAPTTPSGAAPTAGIPPELLQGLGGSSPAIAPPAAIGVPAIGVPGVGIPEVPSANTKLESNLLLAALKNGNIDFGSLLKEAGPLAAQQVAPMITALMQQGAFGANTIQGYTRGAQQDLQGVARDIGQNYANAEAVQGQISKGIVSGLGAMSPNAQDQQVLQSTGADALAQKQIANQNNESFNTAGKVIGGLGNLNASSLAAQGAAAKSYAQQLPALLDVSGQQALAAEAIGNQSALAKLYGQQGAEALKLAGQLGAFQQKTGAGQMSAYKTLTGQDTDNRKIAVGVEEANARNTISVNKANASNAIAANKANASNYLATVRASTSAYNARTARARYGLSLYKTFNPTATTKMSETQSKDAITSAEIAAGIRPGGTHIEWTKNPSTGTKVPHKVPNTTPQSYETWVQEQAAAHSTMPDAVGYYTGVANSVFNYGYGDRPLDAGMTDALTKAGAQPSFHTNTGKGVPGVPHGTPFFTLDQAEALKNGYKSFVGTLKPVMVPGVGQVFVIPKLR